MPYYLYECGDCEAHFEISCPMSEIQKLKPKCPECGKKKNVYRDFSGTIVSIPKTLGSLAEKNARGMSEDHKSHLNKQFNEYKKKPFTGGLPTGAKTYKRDSDGNRIPRS